MESEESALDDPLGKSGPNSLFFFFVIFSSIPMPLYVFIFEQPPPGVFKQNPTPWPPSPSHGTQGLEKPKRCSLLEQKSHNFASSFLNAGIWELAILAPTDPIPSVFPLRIMVPFCVESALSGVVFAATDMFVSSITEAHLYIDRGPKHNQHLGNPLFSIRQYYIPVTRFNHAIFTLHHQHHLVQVMAPLPPNHRLVYRRTFRLPPWVKNQRRTLLHFQAVDHQTEVISLCPPWSRCLLTEFKLEATLADTMPSASISPTCWRRNRRQNKNCWLSLRIQPSLRFFVFFSGFLVKVNFRRFQLESNGRVGRGRLGLSSTHQPRESGRWANCISRSRKSLIVNESLMAQQQNNCSDRLVGRGSRGAHHQDICPTAPWEVNHSDRCYVVVRLQRGCGGDRETERIRGCHCLPLWRGGRAKSISNEYISE